MSKAAFELSKGEAGSHLDVALKFATKANAAQGSDSKVTAHYAAVKARHAEVTPSETPAPAEQPKAASSVEQKMRSRVKIPVDGVDKEEEKAPEPKPTSPPSATTTTPQAPPVGTGMGDKQMKQGLEQLENMDEAQMDNMVNMMKSNPAMMKANYERQMGQKLTDQQFEQMMQMMNP